MECSLETCFARAAPQSQPAFRIRFLELAKGFEPLTL